MSTPPTIDPSTPAPAPKSILRDGVGDRNRDSNRMGRESEGLYPNVSRNKLAKALGLHISTVSGYLRGRTRMPMNVALLVAKALKISLEKLNADLTQKQMEYAEEQVGRAEERVKEARRKKRGSGQGKAVA